MADSHKPTTELKAKVDALASFGVAQTKIAKYIGINFKTLTKHYSDILETADVDKNAAVANALFQKAIEGNVPSMIFWLKTRAGWRETDNNEANKEEPVSRIQIEVLGSAEVKDA